MSPNTHQSKPAKQGRILFATIGSLGDLHPCLALALELKRRGHSVTVASTECYRPKVEALGIAFTPIRPNWNPTDPEFIRESDDLKRGFEVLYRNWLLPHLKDTFDDLLTAASESDLMIAGELNLAAPLVAEKLGLRWVSAILSPVSFLSARDPSVLVNAPWLFPVRKAGWRIYRAFLNMARLGTLHWWNPVRNLRRQQHLSPHADPIFRDKFSPHLVLALFSHWLAQPQPDWPTQTLQTGFVYFDRPVSHAGIDPALAAFLAAGDPPIVFTQGSTAVHNPGDFYQVAAEAAARLGRRALLIGAPSTSGTASQQLLALPYAPYSQVFPHAAINVHQGGSGTTGQALRAGRPQLIVPYGWDQPDNAARVERLGLGLHVPRSAWALTTATAALKQLLHNNAYSACAAQVGAAIRAEDGLTSACDAIDSLFRR
ncbi:MAG: nucleotide disphospho-sugar-binding domain-containing protein [Terracidiphilus sp.]|jgi:UDP:flavonoid glycosyltransferase YjiC (YdhE family)